jgi:hypothetical protein
VLFHFGTNDAWNNIAPQTILKSFGVVVDEFCARNPNVWVLVAQSIAMNPVNDQWTSYDANADSNGAGVHPSETGGSEKMAVRWLTRSPRCSETALKRLEAAVAPKSCPVSFDRFTCGGRCSTQVVLPSISRTTRVPPKT